MAKQKEATSAASRLELPADPRAALERLRTLLAEGVPAGEIAAAAAGINDAGAAELLTEMEARVTGATRREVRRALFRLRQHGINAPQAFTAAPAGPAAATGAGLSGFVSHIDPEDAQIVWLVKARSGGGLSRLRGLVSEHEGLVTVSFDHLSRRELREERQELERRLGIKLMEADWQLADHLLCDAYRRTTQEQRSKVGDFLALRAELVATPPAADFVHPIYRELADRLAVEPALEPLAEAGLTANLLSADELAPYLKEIGEIRQSPLVLNRFQQEERVEKVVASALGALFTPLRRRIIQRRLENLALTLSRANEPDRAAAAAGAAARLRDGVEPASVPFFVQLVRQNLSAALSEQQQKAAEEPRLIVTPTEALRAQA